MRLAFLAFLVLLGYAAFLFLVFLSLARVFTKRFSRFWQPCFYLCLLALVALMAVLPLTNRGRANDDFVNNAIMFLPLVTACLILPFVAFKKQQRYFALGAVSLSIVAFFCYARTLWLSNGDCATLPTRFFHKLVGRDRDSFVNDTRFKVWTQGTAGTPEGYITDFTKLRSRDCVEVTFETESMSSQAEAESELKKKISIAFRVVEHGFKVDIPEHPDGERAVLLFDNGARTEIVIWFKGERWLHIIESKSLAHALACEKLIQRGYRMDAQGYVLASGQ